MTSLLDLELNTAAPLCPPPIGAVVAHDPAPSTGRGTTRPRRDMNRQARCAATGDGGRSSSAPKPQGSDPERPVWVVRLDRPDGTHNFVGPEPGEVDAEVRCKMEQRRWSAAGLWAPTTSVVTMSAAAFVEHARRQLSCTSTMCPRAGASVACGGDPREVNTDVGFASDHDERDDSSAGTSVSSTAGGVRRVAAPGTGGRPGGAQ